MVFILIYNIFTYELLAHQLINKNIGVFVDLNNVGFQKWQRFYKYPTYNFQVIGGVKLNF